MSSTSTIAKPHVSVCIPVYGVETYIERCARSLFDQTLTEGVEFIFVNDCTKDKSIDILERILNEYPHRKAQVHIIHHEKNRGLVAARNTALKYAAGDYIIHCDSDDWVDTKMYEIMYKKAVETNADMVYCNFFLAVENKIKKIKQKACGSPSEMIVAILSGSCHGAMWNKLYKRSIALQDFYTPDHIIMTEDVLRNVQMLAKASKVLFIDSPLYYYSYTPSSITNTRNKKCFENEKEVVNFIEKNIVSIYNCHSSLNVYKRRVLSDSVIFKCITSKEFHSLYPEAKRELFTRINLNDSFKRKILLRAACFCFPVVSYLLRAYFYFKR